MIVRKLSEIKHIVVLIVIVFLSMLGTTPM